MVQRTALEQDLVDFGESIQKIFERQIELQTNIMELLALLVSRFQESQEMEKLSISVFGVNLDGLKFLNEKAFDDGHSSNKDNFGLSL